MIDSLEQLAQNPWWVFFGVLTFAWLWEDGALISGALLAADGAIHPVWGALAVLLGICSGDAGLYYMGVLARRVRALRARLYKKKNFRQMRYKFSEKTFSNILLIRFIPGLRTIGFSFCGFVGVGFIRFMIAMTLAGVVWVSLLYMLIYFLGSSDWFVDSYWKWSFALVAVALLFINNRPRTASTLASVRAPTKIPVE